VVSDASKEAPGKGKSPYMHSFLHLRLRKKGKTGIEDTIISSTQQVKCCNVGSWLSASTKKLHVLVLPASTDGFGL
jgi:hypothetical protein